MGLRRIREDGVEAYEGWVRCVRGVRAAGLPGAVVSPSTNCRDVLVAAGIEDLFDARIDGVVAEREHLRGKPAPDTFLAGARALGLRPPTAVVFEDALAGVAAGRAGGVRFVVGRGPVWAGQGRKEQRADIAANRLAAFVDRPRCFLTPSRV